VASPYRLSTGQQHEVIRAVLEQEPERPSVAMLRAGSVAEAQAPGDTLEQAALTRGSTPTKLARRFRGDLDTIVLKAMEKDPARRYGTAEQLEDDVRNHLAGLPVTARPATRLYHIRKFCGVIDSGPPSRREARCSSWASLWSAPYSPPGSLPSATVPKQ